MCQPLAALGHEAGRDSISPTRRVLRLRWRRRRRVSSLPLASALKETTGTEWKVTRGTYLPSVRHREGPPGR